MKHTTQRFFLLLLLLYSSSSYCQVRLPRLISDGMILQRESKARIWGWASPGEEVTVVFNKKNYSTQTGTDGKWLVTLQALKAGGPYTMEIYSSNHIIISNILVGDVWVCSGQSNMVLPMERVKEKYPDAIEKSENQFIRQFIIPMQVDFNTTADNVSSGKWESANRENVLRFSATAYFFAKELYQKYGVPVGLIITAIGGSPVEAWLSEEALQKFPDILKAGEKFKHSEYIDSIKRAENSRTDQWYANIQKNDEGLKGTRWSEPTVDDSQWPTMAVPGFWKDNGLADTNGAVWFRKEIDITPSMAGKPAKLFLGRIIDRDSAFLNGTFVGAISYQYPPRRYSVPSNILKAGKNILAVRIISTSGPGGFVKDKPYELIVDDQIIDLKGTWKFKQGTSSPPLASNTFFQYKPRGLFNGMIAPLTNYGIKGVIWYQGESNTEDAGNYRQLFSTMIYDWRQKWDMGTLPFLYVQLANFMGTKDKPEESNWASLREAQRRTLSLEKTGMAVAIDLGEWNDIHPLNKEDVGKRLARTAIATAFNDKKIVASGPEYESMTIDGNKIVLSFKKSASPLSVKGGGELKYFAIAGADKKFTWAKAKISGNNIIVWSDDVQHPVAVRYAWADNPDGANLYNKEGLPASPFTTE